jgi:hypothetical protein
MLRRGFEHVKQSRDEGVDAAAEVPGGRSGIVSNVPIDWPVGRPGPRRRG